MNKPPLILPYIPEPLLERGPWNLAYWQWAGMAIVIVAGFFVAGVLAWLTRAALRPLVRRSKAEWDDKLIDNAHAPLVLGWWILASKIGFEFLDLSRRAMGRVDLFLRVMIVVAIFWGLIRAIKVVGEAVITSARFETHAGLRSMIPLATRVAVVLIFLFMVVSVLATLGYPVASFIAGLGIGGLAVALAAQKTMENFFGSLSIAGDRPFRVGDFVKIDSDVGTVEALGLRSTRVRTLDRTLITWPNGKLADTKVENYGVRDRFRLHIIIGVLYSTKADQLRQVRDGFEAAIRAHPAHWPDAVSVRVMTFADFSIQLEVMCWFQVANFEEFKAVREHVLLDFMRVVDEAGTEFAFPTRTVHVSSAPVAPTDMSSPDGAGSPFSRAPSGQ